MSSTSCPSSAKSLVMHLYVLEKDFKIANHMYGSTQLYDLCPLVKL